MKKFLGGSSNDLSQLSLSTFTNFHNLSLNFISRPRLDVVDDEVTCLTLTQLPPRFHFTKKSLHTEMTMTLSRNCKMDMYWIEGGIHRF